MIDDSEENTKQNNNIEAKFDPNLDPNLRGYQEEKNKDETINSGELSRK